jgi:hypothetical protein
MGKTLKYVDEFDFGPSKVQVKGYSRGGPMCKAEGGAVDSADVKQDKKMIKTAVHKHERAQHPGKPLTKLRKGGAVLEKATGERYPSREAMIKHEATETPSMQKEEMVRRSKVVAPRRSVPVAPVSPLLAMKHGGMAKKK